MFIRLHRLPVLLPAAFAASIAAADDASLGELVVTATRQSMRTDEVLSDVTLIERDAIETAGHSTLEQILAAQPGIQMAANGSPGAASYLYIRGTNPKHVLLLVDGMRMGSATSGEATWSRIPAAQIERIEIIRGPASSLYGSDAIGGVVQVFTRAAGSVPLRLTASAGAGADGARSASAGISGSRDHWRYALNLADDVTDGFNSKPDDPKANPDRDGFRNRSASGRLGYRFAPGHEVMLTALHAEGRSDYDGSGVSVDWENRTRNGAASLTLKNALGEYWHSTFSIGHSVDASKNLKNGVRSSEFNTRQRQYAWQHDIRAGGGNFLVGVERLTQEIDTSGNYRRDRRHNDAIQFGWQQGFGAHRVQASLRRDDDSLFGGKTTGLLAYGYRLAPNWRGSVSVGTAFKAPTFNELYYPASGSYAGNPALQPESSRNREFALHYEGARQQASLTLYHNRIEDMIAWTRVGALNQPTNIDSARLRGATLTWGAQLAGFDLNASYDWLDAEDRKNHRQLPRRARQTATLAVTKTLGEWTWHADLLVSDRRYEYKSNARVSLSGYTLANLYAAYRLSPDWSLFARINNLFDRDYTLADGYATAGRNAFIGIRYSPQ